MAATKPKQNTEVFACGYCGKEYKREASLIKHKCEKKKRALLRGTKDATVALDIWLRFRKIAKLPYKKSLQPYDAFSESKEFTGFYEFAQYLIKAQMLQPEEFTNELLRDSIPIRDWTSFKLRKAWTQKILRRESPDAAIERSVLTITEWADQNETDWRNFFKEVSPQRAILLIETGKISPWFIYSASTRNELLSRFSDEEFMHIFEYIDPHVWNAKKLKFKEEAQRYEAVFLENGI